MEEATITLQGKGAIHVVPDVTRLEVKIDQWFADYGKAYEQARENSAWMVKILEYNKKTEKLAKTVRLDIGDYTENEYDDDGNFIRTVKKGYTLDQRIKIDLPIDNHLVNCIVRGKLRGVVEHITYQNPENGWSVMQRFAYAIHNQTVSRRNTKLKERLNNN